MPADRCVKCNDHLFAPGALIFSYPGNDDMVLKFHVCQRCWHASLLKWIDEPLSAEEQQQGVWAPSHAVESHK